MKLPALLTILTFPLVSCVTPPPAPFDPYADITMRNEEENKVVNAEGDKVLKEIPPKPAGTEFKATEPTFRSRSLALPDGTWTVDFEGGSIAIVTAKKKKFTLPMSWYPEEGGADGAFCSAHVDGGTTWILLSGSSDYYDELTRIRFTGGVMKEVLKHRVPGSLKGAVPAGDRIKSQVFE